MNGNIERLVLLEDEPIRDVQSDYLGLAPFARVIAGACLGTQGPFTIGVFAGWGQGKTSVLHLARSLIEEAYTHHPEMVTVWFNAWQYEKEEHPIIPLVASIVRAVEGRRQHVQDGMEERFGRISRALRAIAYGLSAKAKIQLPGFAEIESGFVAKEMVERYEQLRTTPDPLLDRSLYYNAFETLSEVVRGLPAEGQDGQGPPAVSPKIVVFIDDLDRCLPSQALKLLEGVKLVFAQPGFLFVLGVDRDVLEGYFRKRYREEFEVRDCKSSGASYLDKLVQLPLPLPTHRGRFRPYIRRVLELPVFDEVSNQQIKEVLRELEDILAVGSNYNPRTLVRFINNLIVDRSLWLAKEQESQGEARISGDSLAFGVVSRILQQHLEDRLHRRLVQNDELCRRLAEGVGAVETWWRTQQKEHADLPKTNDFARELLREMAEAEFLQELMTNSMVKRWLTDHETRKKIEEFMGPQRSQLELVEDALRQALAKKPDAKITPEDRSRVTVLDLSFEQITDKGLTYLLSLKALQKLDLQGTGVKGTGLELLRTLSDLQTLNLSDTDVTDEGLVHLNKLLKLQDLDIGGTDIGNDDLEQVSALSELVRLSLRETEVTDSGLKHLKGLSNLQDLDLSGTKIGHKGLKHLRNLKSLALLDLSGTRVGDEGIEALEQMGDLVELYFEDGQLSKKALATLQDKLNNCRISIV